MNWIIEHENELWLAIFVTGSVLASLVGMIRARRDDW